MQLKEIEGQRCWVTSLELHFQPATKLELEPDLDYSPIPSPHSIYFQLLSQNLSSFQYIHAHKRAHTHTRTHTRTHARTHCLLEMLWIQSREPSCSAYFSRLFSCGSTQHPASAMLLCTQNFYSWPHHWVSAQHYFLPRIFISRSFVWANPALRLSLLSLHRPLFVEIVGYVYFLSKLCCAVTIMRIRTRTYNIL
jgi:hypothetical protein